MDDFASFSPKKSDEDWMNEAESVLKAYQGKSEAEILKAIYARAVEGKRNGTLTNEQIDAFYAQFSPMVDGFKRRRLKQLVEQLKKM
ncbi:MAG: hypothetical protein IKD43_02025 [Clostridia bacterium]|nr:hypothetical protein [Clostridia bacterium]